MDSRLGDNMREKHRRPIRNKRHCRRTYGEDKRPPKRLFTPEIKRFLKDWLIRRRENPYPNRDEKKILAIQTGLTYIQVCNWFANWRRKLKNSGKEPQSKTWGDLIKTYNNQVEGNIEHFSICSDDSIWEETVCTTNFPSSNNYQTVQVNGISLNYAIANTELETRYVTKDTSTIRSLNNNNNQEIQNQCYLVTSTTELNPDCNPFSQQSNKYKNHIMEKYLRDCRQPEDLTDAITEPSMISKWLESAVNFKPNENSYLEWTLSKPQRKKTKSSHHPDLHKIHGREELDAAEALTTLANASRSFKSE